MTGPLVLTGMTGSIVSASTITAVRFEGSGAGLTGVTGATDSTKVLKAGDIMTGLLSGTSVAMTGQVSASNYVIRGSTVLRTGGLDTMDQSIYLGYRGVANTAGINNTMVGTYSGHKAATGNANTLIGNSVGFELNAVDNSTIVGSQAGRYITVGNGTFYGFQSGFYNTTGASNSLFGLQSGWGNFTGSQNTIMGFQAGYGVYNNNNSSNTYMGYRAGYATTTGGSNTCIGSGACLALTTGSNNIVIGNGAATLAVGTNNSLNIGGLITGDLNEKIVYISSTTISASSVTLLGLVNVANGKMVASGTDGVMAVNNPITTSYIGFQFQEAGVAKAELNYIGSGYVTAGRQKDLEIVGNSAGDITMWPGSTFSTTFDRTGKIGVGTNTPVAYFDMNLPAATASTDYAIRVSSRSTGEIQWGVHTNGHISMGGASPTIITCANGAISGNDGGFKVTFSGANSSCEIAFGEPFDAEPICVPGGVLTAANETPTFSVEVSSSITIVPATGAWGNGDKINVLCFGKQCEA